MATNRSSSPEKEKVTVSTILNAIGGLILFISWFASTNYQKGVESRIADRAVSEDMIRSDNVKLMSLESTIFTLEVMSHTDSTAHAPLGHLVKVYCETVASVGQTALHLLEPNSTYNNEWKTEQYKVFQSYKDSLKSKRNLSRAQVRDAFWRFHQINSDYEEWSKIAMTDGRHLRGAADFWDKVAFRAYIVGAILLAIGFCLQYSLKRR